MSERPPWKRGENPASSLALGAAPRILVVKLATPGDVLLASPALRALRRRYPDAEIDLLTTDASARMVRHSPLLHTIYTLDKYAFDTPAQIVRQPLRLARAAALLARLRARRYDTTLLMHHLTLRFGALKYRALVDAIGARVSAGLDNGRGGFLDVRIRDDGFGVRHEAEYSLAVAAAVGATLPPGQRGVHVEDLGWSLEETEAGTSLTPAMVAMHPGSGRYSVARRWPADRFAKLGLALHEQLSLGVVLVGAEDERELCEDVLSQMGRPGWACNAAGRTSPEELASTLHTCALFVGNDSLPMHIAAAVGTPVVAIFGPTNVRAWGPYVAGGRSRAIVVRRGNLPCSPCMYRGHALGTPQGCPARMCLTELGIQPVLEASRRLLHRASARAVLGG